MNFLKPLYLASAAIGLLPVSSGIAAERPNVLLITVDDLKPLLGVYGNTDIPTPNFDRLAERGTVMTHAYCQQAVCAPSRMSMYTGLRPDSTRVWDLQTHIQDSNPDAVTMQQWFRQAGYTSEGAGKVIHGARNNHPESWSTPFVVLNNLPFNKDYPMPTGTNLDYQGEFAHEVAKEMEAKNITGRREQRDFASQRGARMSFEEMDVPDDAYVDGAVTVWAEGRLKTYAKSREPFFLSVGYMKPHLPFVAPKKYWDMLDRDKIKLAEFQEHAANSPSFAYHKFGELRSYSDITKDWDASIDEAKQRELIHGYYACIAYIDAQIGKLLDTLDSTGLSKNTIIVLWGDHGYHLGDHGMWNKHSNFEQATRVPLIISAPGMPTNQMTSAMAEMVDVFPTLVELAGLQAPYELEGKSLVPVLKDAGASVKDFSISQYPRGNGRMGYALRTPRYRFVMWMRNDWRTTMPFDQASLETVELYDYEKDPLETVNLANNSAYAQVRKELTEKMLEYFALYAKQS